MKFCSVRDLRINASRVVRQARRSPIVVTLRGKPVAALVPLKEKEMEQFVREHSAPPEKFSMDRDLIQAFCRRHRIRKLSLFGSFLRNDFSPSSDVDALVEFEPGHTPGLAFFDMERELSELLGRKVDLQTPASLSPLFRAQVVAEARTVYDAS